MNNSIDIAVIEARRHFKDLQDVVEISKEKTGQTYCILIIVNRVSDATKSKLPKYFHGYRLIVRNKSEDSRQKRLDKESHEETLKYWTNDRMNNARPIDLDIDDPENDQVDE